jgi:hypothetical protein
MWAWLPLKLTNRDDLAALLPSRWQPAAARGPVVDVETTACVIRLFQ